MYNRPAGQELCELVKKRSMKTTECLMSCSSALLSLDRKLAPDRCIWWFVTETFDTIERLGAAHHFCRCKCIYTWSSDNCCYPWKNLACCHLAIVEIAFDECAVDVLEMLLCNLLLDTDRRNNVANETSCIANRCSARVQLKNANLTP